ncbi:odorant receptor 10-like [Calliopsis andreniformis]|uniref:odorant receptor 10-like n=1 Tax=Calliopsis andreniformis TaxID=337506 RepID=UPI003FCE7609
MMAEDWAKCKTDREKVVMIRQARIGHIFSWYCYSSAFIQILAINVLPKFGIQMRYVLNGTDEGKSFPIPVYYMHQAYQSPYFEMLFTLQLISLPLVLCTYTGVDNFVGNSILHVCGQLENLRDRFSSIEISENFNQVLGTIVEDHIRLTSAVDVIEHAFTIFVLILFLYFMSFVCIYGLLLISLLTKGDHESVVRSVFIVLVLIHTHIFCKIALTYFSRKLNVKSENLYHAVYKCDWINLKSKEAKNLILIIARCSTPLYITAGKLFPMSLLTFCNVSSVSCLVSFRYFLWPFFKFTIFFRSTLQITLSINDSFGEKLRLYIICAICVYFCTNSCLRSNQVTIMISKSQKQILMTNNQLFDV